MGSTTSSDDSRMAPFLLLGGSFVLIAALLIFSGQEEVTPEKVPPRIPGGGSVGALVPGAPLPGDLQNGAGLPDGPSVTIVETVRDTLHLLPLDRNNPEVYDPPVRVRKPT
jgi:hypothetical protein